MSVYGLLLFGSGLGVMWVVFRLKTGGFERIAEQMIHRAELEIQEKTFKEKEKSEVLRNEREKESARKEERLRKREENCAERLLEIEAREKNSARIREELEEEKREIQVARQEAEERLEKAAGLSALEAKEYLLEKTEQEIRLEMAQKTQRICEEAEADADEKASRILATTIGRMVLPCVSELAVTTVQIPSEEMKRKIIGREGRNIRVLESLTGVNFLIETSTVVISGFDPIRRYIAKTAIQFLIQDGRIHPTKIEEMITRAHSQVEREIEKRGQEAVDRAGLLNLHPVLTNLLGKLGFRYSYGQNILEHALEVSHIMGIIASELGLDCALAKRIGLLHDVGKAVSFEVEGSHALIGSEYALKYGESEAVSNGIGCHHDEIPPQTIEGSLCGAADALSAARPGARHEAVEQYLKRLQKLERLATQHDGVEKAFALKAGKEIRVIVEPDQIDDAKAFVLARTLAKEIEEELSYPGKIKITVIREKRAVEYAS